MRRLALSLLSISVLISAGCVSKVVTYDRHNTKIGSCTISGIALATEATCYGYSNPENLQFSKPVTVSRSHLTQTTSNATSVYTPSPVSTTETPKENKVILPKISHSLELNQTTQELPELPVTKQISITNLSPIY